MTVGEASEGDAMLQEATLRERVARSGAQRPDRNLEHAILPDELVADPGGGPQTRLKIEAAPEGAASLLSR